LYNFRKKRVSDARRTCQTEIDSPQKGVIDESKTKTAAGDQIEDGKHKRDYRQEQKLEIKNPLSR